MQIHKVGIKQDTQPKPQTNKKQHYKQLEQHRTNKQVQGAHCHTIQSECVKKHLEHMQKYGIQTGFKSGRTLKNSLVAPKDKDTKKSGVIYWLRCTRLHCYEKYIGESARTFSERFKEHLKVPSPIYEHQFSTGHSTLMDDCSVQSRDCTTLLEPSKNP